MQGTFLMVFDIRNGRVDSATTPSVCSAICPSKEDVVPYSDWDIRRSGRAWGEDEFHQRLELRPEKLEIWDGKLLWTDEERIELLGLLLENLGTDEVVRLGNIDVWRDAIATRWLREVKGTDPAYLERVGTWASEFVASRIESNLKSLTVEVEIGNPITDAYRAVGSVPVNAEAMLSWIPADVLESLAVERRKQWRFQQEDGSIIHRSTGAAGVRVAGAETIDEVVFAEPGDRVVLGARSLDGLNLRIDPLNGRLVDGGPAPAAVTT
jgi:hypothetical protein